MKKRVTTAAKGKAKTKAKTKAKKPATFRTLKAAARAIKAKTKKPAKLDRDTPAQKDKVQLRVERAGRIQLVNPKGFPVRPSDTRWPREVDIGKRHRKDFGDLAELAGSIDARGGLLQPIAITSGNMLIAGERRMKAWPLTRFKDQPIPVRVIDVDSIIAGEWDENARRKDFTPEEAAKISEEIERQLKVMAAARMKGGKKADPAQKGNASDHAARATGIARRTIDKAKAVVKAAEAEPERFGKLRQDMNRTGKVDGPYKRLMIMQQKDAINKAPAPLPMRGPYNAIVVDYPWPAEKEADQATIDRRGRAMRDYPEMSIEEGKKLFKSKEFQALLAPDCRIYFWSTNHHVDSAFDMMKAAGFDKHSTIGTWGKDKMGNGQVLRGKTEQCILFERGKPVTDIQKPDGGHWTTDWSGEGWEVREDSRKPDAFFAMVEQHTPSPRYAEIFSRGGRNDKWDCHGDQAGKFAPSVAKEAQAAILAEVQLTPEQQLQRALEAIEKGETPDLRLIDKDVGKRLDDLIEGKNKFKLTAAGKRELAELREEQNDAAIAGTLPDGQDGLAAAYRETVTDFGAAVREGDRAAAETNAKRAEIILRKANGLTEPQWFFDVASEKSAAAKVMAAAAAPLGEIPPWGRNGLFTTVVDGVDYLVLVHAVFDMDSFVADISLYPACRGQPWLNGQSDCYTGIRARLDDVLKCGGDFTAWCSQEIRTEVADSQKRMQSTGPKRKKGAPKPQLAPAKNIYALPATWDGISEPRRASGKAKSAAPLVKVDDTHQVAEAYVTPKERKQLARAAAKAARTLPGRDKALITFAEQNGHVVSMTLDHGTDEHVGTCQCGAFEHRYKGIGQVGDASNPKIVKQRMAAAAAMDDAITAHWRAMRDHKPDVTLPLPAADEPAADAPDGGGVPGAASASPAGSADDGSQLDIPGFLRREDDNSVAKGEAA